VGKKKKNKKTKRECDGRGKNTNTLRKQHLARRGGRMEGANGAVHKRAPDPEKAVWDTSGPGGGGGWTSCFYGVEGRGPGDQRQRQAGHLSQRGPVAVS